MSIERIRLKGRELKPHKAMMNPLMGARTVLTQSSWDFVSLWLKKENHQTALFYWHQAEEFNRAAQGMPSQSAPLLHYYSFMNAAKALLVVKGVAYDEMHGLRAHNMRNPNRKISISNEGVRILQKGILPSLSSYLQENEHNNIHNLQELLFNLPYIHRTYCLTYPKQTEMFIPLVDCYYVVNTVDQKAYLQATLSKDYQSKHVLKRLPIGLTEDISSPGSYVIRSTMDVEFLNPKRPTQYDLNQLLLLQKNIRQYIHYINGAQTLWYVKTQVSGPNRLQRFSLTITLAAMHRLSEICRYRPLELASFLSGQENWLLNEFIKSGPNQFIDEISSEITGHQFLIPNIRTAT